MGTQFDANIASQPALLAAILAAPAPRWFAVVRKKPVTFIGTGSSFFGAQLAAWMWRRHVSPLAWAVNSFDFVRQPRALRKGEAAVLLSHSGGRSYTYEAGLLAKKSGALTVGLTMIASPWRRGLDHRVETSEREIIEPFTLSLTTTLAWIAKMTGSRELTAGLARAAALKGSGAPFPRLSAVTDLVLLGDGAREWVARETALKLQEAARLKARPFGLEEFLHGPKFSAGPGTLAVCFSDKSERRWEALRSLLRSKRVPLVEVRGGPGKSSGWLTQLFWGQRFTADACRQLGADPDIPRPQR
jgi:fructoselysine-6-P-deglycase FrlB-like protein